MDIKVVKANSKEELTKLATEYMNEYRSTFAKGYEPDSFISGLWRKEGLYVLYLEWFDNHDKNVVCYESVDYCLTELKSERNYLNARIYEIEKQIGENNVASN